MQKKMFKLHISVEVFDNFTQANKAFFLIVS